MLLEEPYNDHSHLALKSIQGDQITVTYANIVAATSDSGLSAEYNINGSNDVT